MQNQKSISDYYPFGFKMESRSWAATGLDYKFAFNGKEQDSEVSGSGNSYDYGFRIYNPRLGKFLSVDPLTKSYPWYTPYQFAGNMPIAAIDLDGLEELIVVRWFDGDKYQGETVLRVNNANQREVGKRQGGDMQLIELDVSMQASFDGAANSLDITAISNVIKNDDGTFKGEYFEENTGYTWKNTSLKESDIKQIEKGKATGAISKRKLVGEKINFEYDKDEIVPLSSNTIEAIKKSLEANPDKQLGITGYASTENETGNEDYNKDLSLKRALKVENYLVKNGIDASRILYVEGAGGTTQFNQEGNTDEENKDANRVVEVNFTYEKTQNN